VLSYSCSKCSIGLCSAEERRRNIEDLHDEMKTLKRRHATSVKVPQLLLMLQCCC